MMNLSVKISSLILFAILGIPAMSSPPPEPYPIALLECTVDPSYLTEEEVSLGESSKFTVSPNIDEWEKEAEGIEISHAINYEGYIYGYIGKDLLTVFYSSDDFYSVVDDLCKEDMTQIIPLLKEYYPLWHDSVRYWGYDTIFLAKFESQEIEQYLLEIEKSWKECNIYKYQHSGKWIVAVDVIRDYCNKQSALYGKTANLNPIKFIRFLFQQPLKEVIPFIQPYLVYGLLLSLGILAAFKINKIRRIVVSMLLLNLIISPLVLSFVIFSGASFFFTMIKINTYLFWIVFIIVFLIYWITFGDNDHEASSSNN